MVELQWRPDGQPATAQPILPNLDIPCPSRGRSHRSRSSSLVLVGGAAVAGAS